MTPWDKKSQKQGYDNDDETLFEYDKDKDKDTKRTMRASWSEVSHNSQKTSTGPFVIDSFKKVLFSFNIRERSGEISSQAYLQISSQK